MSSEAASADLLRLARLPRRTLRSMMDSRPGADPMALVGWEYRGVNMPAAFAVAGIRRFIKGFHLADDGSVLGYNVAVAGASLEVAWQERRQPDGRRAFAPFLVSAVDSGLPHSRYPHALLLDYGAAHDPALGPATALASRLRDYVVRVRRGSDDLLLGRAFLSFDTIDLPVAYFALERRGPTPT